MIDEKQRTKEFYDQGAKYYDLISRVLGLFGFRTLRKKLLRQAVGKVLEVGIGTGLNLSHYTADSQLTGVDLSPKALDIARRRAKRLKRQVELLEMDTESLNFPDQSFDTVVSTLTICGYPDPVKALIEIRRVTKATGKILLLEHGRSSRRWLARWQDKRDKKHVEKRCCHKNRDPFSLSQTAGLTVIRHRRFGLGTIYWIEATP